MTDPIITIAISPHCSWQGYASEAPKLDRLVGPPMRSSNCVKCGGSGILVAGQTFWDCDECDGSGIHIINLGEGI